MTGKAGHAVVIYARFSSRNQRDASIEDQVRACRAEAERRGDRIVGVYEDRARTGTTTAGRDEFLRMMEESKRAEWKVVYVYKLDRFARDRYDFAMNRKRLRDRDIELRSVAESVPEGPEGIILETLLEGLAEYYSANLSQNVRRGMEGNALKCMHNGARLYGYDLGEDGFYHVNEDEARVVRIMFDMYDQGSAAPQIVEALAPYRTRTGKRFRMSHVMRMLRNEKYAGTYVYKEHRVPGGMEAIVTMEQYRRVNEMIGSRKARRPRRGKERYLLTGKLFDEEGRPYVGVSGTARDGSKRCYYKCLETGVAWRKSEVEDAMLWSVAEMLQATPETCEEIARMVAKEEEDRQSEDLLRLNANRRRQAEIGRQIDNLTDAIAAGVDPKPLVKRMNELVEERDALETEAAELEDAGIGNMYELALYLLECLREAAATPAMALPFVSRMVIEGEEGNTHVEFALNDRTPVDQAAGVRIARKWLGHCDRIRTVAIRANVFVWSDGSCIVISCVNALERPRRGRHW